MLLNKVASKTGGVRHYVDDLSVASRFIVLLWIESCATKEEGGVGPSNHYCLGYFVHSDVHYSLKRAYSIRHCSRGRDSILHMIHASCVYWINWQ